MTEKSLVKLNIPIKIRQQYFIFILETSTCQGYKYGINEFLFYFSFWESIKIYYCVQLKSDLSPYGSFVSGLNGFTFKFAVYQDGVPSSLCQIFLIVIFSLTLDSLPLGWASNLCVELGFHFRPKSQLS